MPEAGHVLGPPDLEERDRRVAENLRVARDANAREEQLSAYMLTWDKLRDDNPEAKAVLKERIEAAERGHYTEFRCECGRKRCQERVKLEPWEYLDKKEDPKTFVMTRGHQTSALEHRTVLDVSGDRYVAIEARRPQKWGQLDIETLKSEVISLRDQVASVSCSFPIIRER